MNKKEDSTQIDSNLNHIILILEERIFLYKKRQLEIKRAVKAYHRADLVPSPLVIQNLLEATLSYELF